MWADCAWYHEAYYILQRNCNAIWRGKDLRGDSMRWMKAYTRSKSLSRRKMNGMKWNTGRYIVVLVDEENILTD